MPETKSPSLTVVGLGEALFDCFPDHTVLGGAPLNVAFHAHQILVALDGRGAVVSRVGNDKLGDRLVAELTELRVDTRHIQRDTRYPTGRVDVAVDERQQPAYAIAEDVAWDHLEFNGELQKLAATCSVVCFGTLAQRHPSSRAAIASFLEAAPQAWRVYDVNLRQDYFSPAVIEQSCRAATMVKLNEEELPRVCQLLGIADGHDDADRQATALVDVFCLEALAVTRGARGTLLYRENRRIEGRPVSYPAASAADSVGAGDACCAGLVCGLLLNWPLEKTVQFANEIGAYVASRPGATPTLPPRIIDQIEVPCGTPTSQPGARAAL